MRVIERRMVRDAKYLTSGQSAKPGGVEFRGFRGRERIDYRAGPSRSSCRGNRQTEELGGVSLYGKLRNDAGKSSGYPLYQAVNDPAQWSSESEQVPVRSQGGRPRRLCLVYKHTFLSYHYDARVLVAPLLS